MFRFRLLALVAVFSLVTAPMAMAETGAGVHGPSAAKNPFPFMTAEMVKQEMAGAHRPVLIDVGSIQEYKSGHIPGAINVPAPAIRMQPARLPKDKSTRIIIYSGRENAGRERAQQAARAALSMGYTYLSVFPGGLPEWIQKKYPVKKGVKP